MLFPSSLPLYYRASLIIAIGGFIFGYVQTAPTPMRCICLILTTTSLDTGTIGPVTSMKSFKDSFGHMTATKHGVVVSAILLPATFTGLFAGNLADIYGRATALIVGSTIFGIGAALEASAHSLVMFIAGRVIAGLGEGMFLGNLAVYVCEIAPARRRGPLASLTSFLIVFGLAFGYFLSYGTARMSGTSMSWRIPLIFHAMVSFSFAAACLTLPPSPRWLQSKGRMQETLATLETLGLASSELEQMAEESDDVPVQRGFASSVKATFRDYARVFQSGSRSRAALACFVMAFQQFSGIDGLLFYAPLLFQQAGLASEQASFLASGVSALAMLAVTIPASIYCDHWGRRTSTIVGGVLLTATMLLIGSLYAANVVHGDSGIARWIVIACIYIFACVYCATWAISFRIYASEIQPSSTRASATSLAQSSNWVRLFLTLCTTSADSCSLPTGLWLSRRPFYSLAPPLEPTSSSDSQVSSASSYVSTAPSEFVVRR
jgi:sugar porter (SP) family MFS transporter